uniref:MTBC n=1 Tax=Arundo donax TaxID=35708 RepID=A0A0A9H5V4_ARUDO
MISEWLFHQCQVQHTLMIRQHDIHLESHGSKCCAVSLHCLLDRVQELSNQYLIDRA